ncbi:carboxyphosphonoenolpyruvate phosphonomutase [Rhizoctonia solani]|uniref:methylisocitrate lyase n=1 Tax=Rhizoctonia solani TaxID=456999 RepID=A0A8H8T1G3_9AGAM|nr:carboxyphosphonoenolpyruvate phosphonomutase [Rhizoctonia solani]QRW25329.1 carboxyphosphonoenolpyruvate phosphonomutase [Rhizoctonia solani]
MVVQPIQTFEREYTIPAHLRHTADEPLSAKASTRLRQLLARPGIVAAPVGAATTAAKLGMPDLAIATLPDFPQLLYPLIADADTGFGGPAMVARTVQMYDRAGVAALHIEDQLSRLVTPFRVRFVVIARTDSAQVLGMDEAIRRLQAAASVGADVAFIEGVKTKELLEKTVKALAPTPVLVNVISGGLTPSFTTQEAEAMGAKIIIFSLVSAVAAVHAIREAMALLKKTGTDHTSAGEWTHASSSRLLAWTSDRG